MIIPFLSFANQVIYDVQLCRWSVLLGAFSPRTFFYLCPFISMAHIYTNNMIRTCARICSKRYVTLLTIAVWNSMIEGKMFSKKWAKSIHARSFLIFNLIYIDKYWYDIVAGVPEWSRLKGGISIINMCIREPLKT